MPDGSLLSGARAVVVNWRDPEHPKAGGAEVLTIRWAQAWQQAGADVTLLTNRFEGAAPPRPARNLSQGGRSAREA